MKDKKKTPAGKPALDLLEEAVQLLRSAPGPVHLCYYTGSIPFVLALLYFWSDMARGAFASDRVVDGSLKLAALFLWMKCWQAVSAAKLRAFLAASEEPRWTAARLWRLLVQQAALQPVALFVRPIAMLATIPYPWVRAYYENAVILGDGGEGGGGALSRNSRRLAVLWTKQNVSLLLWLLFVGFVVWLNVVVIMVWAPQLLRMFTGIDTRFAEISVWDLVFNTTFIASSIGCAYLCVNPLTKAAYVLRCFYGESLHSGDDLRLGMRRAAAVAAAAAVVLLMVGAPAARAETAQPAAPAAQGSVKRDALDDSISRVLKRDEFTWRLPRQEKAGASGNFFTRWLDGMQQMAGRWTKAFGRWLGQVLDRIFRSRTPVVHESSGASWGDLGAVLHLVVWVILVVVVCLLGWLVWVNRSGFRRRPRLKAQAVIVAPDLNSEDIVASQLPEDEWVKMARDLMARGEFRLAIRALYLAALAHLGLRELISIARHKSNRDYQRELRRRAAGQGELLDAFGESVSAFESVWYGEHAAGEESVRQYAANIERIKVA